jgi:exosortase A-associated hydrolase 2
MTPVAGSANAEAFFLDSGTGQRFCLFHPPGGACRGAIVYVPPFGEEMNKSRRMAALQARALAALGFGVLQIDLHGCGDSSGEIGDARWDGWKSDLALAHSWLAVRLDGAPVSLWGLRLGALLALDYAAGAAGPLASLLLWQPVQSGKIYLTQFLRLRVASDMLAEDKQAGNSTNALREQLQAGHSLEIAGYDLTPELAAAIDELDMSALAPAVPVHWFEAVAAAGRELPPGAARVAAAWRQAGCALQLHLIACPPFWSAQEITEAPTLLQATADLFAGVPA